MPKCSANTVASMMCGATVEYPQRMPSISERFRPASDIASSAALLIRSSEDEPSCLPNAVRPTPVMKLMAVRLRLISSFRDRRCAPPRNDGSIFPPIMSSNTHPSIRLRQTQHFLGNKAENELRADRGDARDQGFTQIALDVVFL